MTWISDDAMARWRGAAGIPDLSGTRYEILEELDRGGMGVVYAALDTRLDREVAIKVLGAGALRPDAAERLVRESKVLAALEHPGIVPVHDAGTLGDGRAWYVMKRVRGRRLDELARSGLSLAEALRLFARVCEPLAFAHARGVVHRDVKPENVMVGEFGEVLVMDWGVAKLLADDRTGAESGAAAAPASPLAPADGGERLTADGDVLGTRGFMAPEQERGESAAVSPRSDVWSLGVLLRELAANACRAEGRRLPKALAAVVGRATAEDPERRYPSAAALADDVVRFADGRPVSAYREPPWERAARWLGRHRLAVAVVAAYLVMRALLYFWLGR